MREMSRIGEYLERHWFRLAQIDGGDIEKIGKEYSY
jgi:hypothetical protein